MSRYPPIQVDTKQLIYEYVMGYSLERLSRDHGFKNANSVYMRLKRYGFTAFRRNFGKKGKERICPSL